MNLVWLLLMCACIGVGIAGGEGAGMTDAVLSACGDAVALCISLAGAYALWCGFMEILEETGFMRLLSRALRPAMRLFPGVRGNDRAEHAVAVNLAANMLGLGNAATPAGLDAIKEMKSISSVGDRASDAMCMFLVINASSLQILPTTVISLRAAAGAAQPFDIFLPTLLATACSTVIAATLMKLVLWGEGRFHGKTGFSRHSRTLFADSSGRQLPRRRRL